MDSGEIIFFVVLGLVIVLPTLWLAILVLVALVGAAVAGALSLLGLATEHGAVGVGIYIMCWIFAFPVMLVVCIISGFFVLRNG